MRVKHYAFAAASVALLVLVLATPSLAAPGNAKPCLCHPTLSPMKGVAKTVYVASVYYRDPDGDAPAKVEVYVDNVAYPMKRVRGRPADGTYRARLTLPPGEHSYYFYAEDARGLSERFPRYGALNGPYVGEKKLLNRLPILSEGGVYFDKGSENDLYTFTVHYRDRDVCKPPLGVNVFIDGICHKMKLYSSDKTPYYQGSCCEKSQPISGPRFNGTYLYQTKLSVGPHAYYFMAKDGDGGCISLPAAGFIRGPEVAAVENTPPALIDQRVEPPCGGRTTRYGFLVHYNDVDFDAPIRALVYIDNVPHPMTRVKGNAANGLYAYSRGDFLSNMHSYYYYFEDGRGGSCRLPAVGVFHGPVVTR